MTGDMTGDSSWMMKRKHSILSRFYGTMDTLEDLAMEDSGLASDVLFTMTESLRRLSQKSWVASTAKVVPLKGMRSR
jgi:hypothetical protein